MCACVGVGVCMFMMCVRMCIFDNVQKQQNTAIRRHSLYKHSTCIGQFSRSTNYGDVNTQTHQHTYIDIQDGYFCSVSVY